MYFFRSDWYFTYTIVTLVLGDTALPLLQEIIYNLMYEWVIKLYKSLDLHHQVQERLRVIKQETHVDIGAVSQYKWPVFPVGSVLGQMVLGLISWNIEIEPLKFFLSLN